MNVSNTSSQLQYAVAVEKKAQATVKEQGQQAVQLIDAAAGAKAPQGTGKLLNVRA